MYETVYEYQSAISNDFQYPLSCMIMVISMDCFEKRLRDEKPRGLTFSHKFWKIFQHHKT